MNMLRKFRLFLIPMCALLFSVTLASCKKESDPNGFYESTLNKSADGFNFDDAHLSSIRIDTSKAKTVFFLGEEFTADGITVKANFLNDNNDKGSLETTDFTVDTKEVDMYNIGTYSVTIIYRYKDIVEKQKYEINVVSSVFATTPNLEYNAGLEVTFGDDTRVKNYLLNDKYVEEYKNDYDHNFNLDSLMSNLKIKLHKNKTNSDATATEEIGTESLTSSQVKIESSQVSINKVGVYAVKVTYANEIEIDGTKYNDDVVAFLIINVEDPIKSILVDEGSALFEQSINGIDAEKAGWKIRVIPTISAAYTEDFSYDKYGIDDVDIFNVGKIQDVTVYLLEDPKVKCTKSIKISASTTQKITQYNNLYPTIAETGADGKPTVITLANTDFIFGPLPNKIDSTTYYDIGAVYTSDRASKDSYGSVTFDERITIKNSNQPIKFVMDNPGQIVVFYASTGDEEREIVLYSDNEGQLGDELQTELTPATKQKITRKTFDIKEAGTYYFVNPSGGIYIHGFIVVTNL